jgi:hypothetical protein
MGGTLQKATETDQEVRLQGWCTRHRSTLTVLHWLVAQALHGLFRQVQVLAHPQSAVTLGVEIIHGNNLLHSAQVELQTPESSGRHFDEARHWREKCCQVTHRHPRPPRFRGEIDMKYENTPH